MSQALLTQSTRSTDGGTGAKPQQHAPAVGHRHVLALLLFLGVLHIYTLRMNMSVACETLKDLYGWSNDEKGLVLSSFYMGYMPGMLPAGMIARQHGKAVFGTAIVGCAVCSLLVPFVAAADITGLCLLRAVTGIFQSGTFPAMMALLAKWVPPAERSRFVSSINSAQMLGTIVGFSVSGWLIGMRPTHEATLAFGGWRWAFFLFALTALGWAVLWVAYVHDQPESHPRIAPAERELIVSSLSQGAASEMPSWRAVPWRRIFASPPVWGLWAAHFAGNWASYTLLNELPSFLKEQLDYDTTASGGISSLPFAASFVVMLLTGLAADAAIARGARVVHVRKLIQVCGMLAAGAVLVVAGYLDGAGAGAVVVARGRRRRTRAFQLSSPVPSCLH